MCVQYFDGADNVENIIPIIIGAFADTDRDVRWRAARTFYADGAFDNPSSPELAIEFVNSPSFDDSPNLLLRPLSEYAGGITRYGSVINRAADIISGPLAGETRNPVKRNAFAGNEISTLLLRLYETAYGARNRELQDDCLDRWDRMLENQVGMTPNHLKLLDD